MNRLNVFAGLFFSLLLIGCDSFTKEPFIVKSDSRKEIFLGMEEFEFMKRLESSKNAVATADIKQNDKIYELKGIKVTCIDMTVSRIEILDRSYSVLNGVRVGDQIYDIPIFGSFILGFSNRLDRSYASKGIISEYLTKKSSSAIEVYARDNLGHELYRSGEKKSENSPIFTIYILYNNGRITSIVLEKESITYVDY